MSVTNEWLILTRFLLCLVASAGLHLGLAIMDWPLQTTQVMAVRQPLTVALVSAAPLVQQEAGVQVQRPAQETARSEPLVSQARPPVPMPASKKQASPQQKPSPQRVAVVSQELTPKEALHAEDSLPLCRPQPVETVQASSEVSEATVVEEGRHETASVSDSLTSLNLLARLDYQATPTSLVGPASAEQGGALTEARPMYSSNRLPVYPRLARQRHWEGVVWLKATVSSQGGVTALEIDTSSGHQVLDLAAHRAVWQWHFQPARRGKIPVAAKVRVPVRFELRDS